MNYLRSLQASGKPWEASGKHPESLQEAPGGLREASGMPPKRLGEPRGGRLQAFSRLSVQQVSNQHFAAGRQNLHSGSKCLLPGNKKLLRDTAFDQIPKSGGNRSMGFRTPEPREAPGSWIIRGMGSPPSQTASADLDGDHARGGLSLSGSAVWNN